MVTPRSTSETETVRVEIVWNSEHFFFKCVGHVFKSSYFAQTSLEFRKFEESLVFFLSVLLKLGTSDGRCNG